MNKSFFRFIFPAACLILLIIGSPLHSLARQEIQKQEQEKKQDQQTVKITEEIVVIGEAPKDRPVSTVSRLTATQIENVQPLDLSEAIRYAPGVMVTFGQKSVYTLKLRGIDSKRIALLIDGIPVYEPYYSSFDLKNIATEGIDSLRLTKGPSSVLYGPNTLGGIVNVVTQRPTLKPSLSLRASYGERDTRQVALKTGFQLKNWAFSGTGLYQDSSGFDIPDEAGGDKSFRPNSEYERLNLNGKIYFTPSSSTELMVNGGIYKSNYSMPPGLMDSKPRYWRFKNWDRTTLNAGGVTALGENSTLRFRGYYVQYDNTLDMFKDQEMANLNFESTFDNSVYGFFALSDLYLGPANSLKFSINYKGDSSRTQDDVDAPWDEFDQSNFSFGAEEHIALTPEWKVVGGLSFDMLNKYIGDNTSRLNPLVGLKYSPGDYWDFHLSFSKKSKFPSMRSMYSSSSGNPDLLSESGSNWEFAMTYNREIFVTASVFLTRFKDMIDSVRLPEYNFERIYFNVAEAYINGFEIQAQKTLDWFSGTLNYTYLDHLNQSDERPLDALSAHNLNFTLIFQPITPLRFSLMGLLASSSSWLDFNTDTMLDIPTYFNLDGIVSLAIGPTEVFMKVTNILNDFIYTEPGFPWRARYAEFGIKARIF